MANYWANDNGLWSTTSNWLTAVGEYAGSLPTINDDVYANNKIIYVDGSYQVSSIRNISAVNITKGGYFVANDGISLSAYVYGGGVSEVACLQFLSDAPASATLIGSLCAGDPSATVIRPQAFRNVSDGNFTIIGNFDGIFNAGQNAGMTTASNGGIINNSNGNLTLVGNFYGDLRLTVTDHQLVCIRNNSNGTITLSGGVFAVTGIGSVGIFNNTGTVVLYGISRGGRESNNFGIYNSNGIVYVYGSVVGGIGASGSGISNQGSGGIIFIYGESLGSDSGGGFGSENASSGTINIFGNVRASLNQDGGIGCSNASTGVVNISGFVIGGGATSSRSPHGIRNSSTGTVNITGVVMGSRSVNTYGISNQSTGIINVDGIVTGGDMGSNGYGIFNNTTGTISGNIIAIAGPRTNSHAIFNNGSGRVFVKKAIGSGWGLLSNNPLSDNPAYGPAVAVFNNSVSGLCYVEEIECGSRGQFPTAGIIYLSAGFDTKATFRNDRGGSITLFDPEFSTRYAPITSDVRLGFVYDNGNLTGTLAIPLSTQVNFGVPVDNTEGSVVFDSENTFNVKTSDIRVKNTIGDRISHVATTSAMRSLINNIS